MLRRRDRLRYQNGTVVPPAAFVDQLLTHAAKATGRPSSTEVMAHARTLRRRALQATNKVGWELQRLRDSSPTPTGSAGRPGPA
ncbi:hypothetical protein [Streptomyces antimycoticus]|uniref:hypothetical protein n=1 Tax=Streptomyces antimycoticus TaxID=68175 RepID=UPI0025703BA9|nr:hypothetical protein [Streptomyces antimycoticus]WJD97266.1 hypothetical protein QR300_15435 [Streptomyces antimycoticus]